MTPEQELKERFVKVVAPRIFFGLEMLPMNEKQEAQCYEIADFWLQEIHRAVEGVHEELAILWLNNHDEPGQFEQAYSEWVDKHQEDPIGEQNI